MLIKQYCVTLKCLCVQLPIFFPFLSLVYFISFFPFVRISIYCYFLLLIIIKIGGSCSDCSMKINLLLCFLCIKLLLLYVYNQQRHLKNVCLSFLSLLCVYQYISIYKLSSCILGFFPHYSYRGWGQRSHETDKMQWNWIHQLIL